MRNADPILSLLTTLRDFYSLHLARLAVMPGDLLFREARERTMREAIGELNKAIIDTRETQLCQGEN